MVFVTDGLAFQFSKIMTFARQRKRALVKEEIKSIPSPTPTEKTLNEIHKLLNHSGTNKSKRILYEVVLLYKGLFIPTIYKKTNKNYHLAVVCLCISPVAVYIHVNKFINTDVLKTSSTQKHRRSI